MLLGRERELELLTDLIRERRPAVVTGEAGVGKTRLAREAAASTGLPLLEGGGLATLAWMPLLPLSRALGRQLEPGDAPFIAREVVEAVGDAVLLVDDAQWLDILTRDVVPLVARRVAVVTTVRTGDPGAPDALRALPDFTAVKLEPLADADAVALARARSPGIDDHAAARIAQLSGGNPMLVEELATAGAASESLRLAVAARLRGLDPAGRDAMERLALLGRPVERDVLGGAAADLERAGLVIAVDGTLAVRHQLLAEAAVAALDDDRRRRLHAELARAVAAPGEAARHHLAAGEREEAYRCALEAADSTDFPGERALHLGVAALAADGADAERLRLRAARDLFHARELDGGEAVLAECTPTSMRARADAASLRSMIALERGDTEGAAASVARGLELAAGSGTPEEAELKDSAAKIALWLHGDFATARKLAREAYDLAREQGFPVARILSTYGIVLSAGPAADATASQRTFEEAVAAAQREGDTMTELTASHNWFLTGAPSVDDWRIARPRVLALLQRARELRLGAIEHHVLVLLGRIDRGRGAYDDVFSNLEPLLDEPLHPQTRWLARHWLVQSALARGDVQRAERHVEGMRSDPQARTYKEPAVATLRAGIALISGRAAAAIEAADEALAHPDVTNTLYAAEAALYKAWASLDVGHEPPRHAEHQTPSLPQSRALAVELRAVGALFDGADEDAGRLFDEGATLWSACDVQGEVRCRWAAAEARRRAGAATAREELESVEVRAAELGLEPILRRVRRSLRLAGVRRSATRRRGELGLTERELEILGLVGEGLTNDDIARRLGVTRPTIEREIHSASGKLGARNRAHAAVLAGGT